MGRRTFPGALAVWLLCPHLSGMTGLLAGIPGWTPLPPCHPRPCHPSLSFLDTWKGPWRSLWRGVSRGAHKSRGTLKDSPQSLLPLILRHKGPEAPAPSILRLWWSLCRPLLGPGVRGPDQHALLSSDPSPGALSSLLFPSPEYRSPLKPRSPIPARCLLLPSPSPGLPPPSLPLPSPSSCSSLKASCLSSHFGQSLPCGVTWLLLPHMGTELPLGSGGLSGYRALASPELSPLVSAVPWPLLVLRPF